MLVPAQCALRTSSTCQAGPSGRPAGVRASIRSVPTAPRHHCSLALPPRAVDSGSAAPWSRASPNRVLAVAVDESEDAVRTFAWALDHLYRPGDTVHLLHVVPAPARTFTPPSGAIGYIPPPPPSAAADLEAAATAFLAARLYPEATARGLDPGAMVRPGVVHEAASSSRRSSSTEAVAFTILKAADEIGASNLVMVSHHKARLHEALWGSVSKTVAAQARIPVTLVH